LRESSWFGVVAGAPRRQQEGASFTEGLRGSPEESWPIAEMLRRLHNPDQVEGGTGKLHLFRVGSNEVGETLQTLTPSSNLSMCDLSPTD